MANVDDPSTWPAPLYMAYYAGTGEAAALEGKIRPPRLGARVEWLDPAAREYWAAQVGDTSVRYPSGGPSTGDGPRTYPDGGPSTGDGPRTYPDGGPSTGDKDSSYPDVPPR